MTLFAFPAPITREPASVDCDESRVTYFIPPTNTEKRINQNQRSRKVRRIFGNNEGGWTRKVEIRTRKNFLAMGEARMTV